MNLVKLQDDLKMLPMAVLQSKAQGQDPQVPPWLATAVLNERMDAQKKDGLAQGAQGEQPSIVEQLSQKAGLMALQGQQQQQAQQQMMSQMAQAPQPAPENVPQPEQQPEPQMMARGGIARLPVDSRMFDYKEGGIIGFFEGNEVPGAEALDTQRVEAAARAKKIKELQAKVKFLRDAGAPQAAQVEAELAALTNPPSKPSASAPPAGLPLALPKPRVAPPQGNVQIPMSPELRAAMEKDAAENGIANPQFNFQGPRGSTATLTQPPPQQAPAQPQQPPAQPPAQPAGLASLPPAAPQQTPIEMARAASEAFPMARKEPSLEGILDIQEKARQAAGAKRAGEPEQEQLAAYQAETERLRKARERADALYTLSAPTGGLGAIAQRDAERQQANNLADTIRNDATEKMRLAMEGMKQAQAAGNVAAYNAEKEKFISAQDARANASITATNELAKQRMQSTTQERGQDIQAETAAKQVGSEEKRAAARDITDRRGQDLHLQAAKLTTAAADARATRDEKRQTLQELSTIGRELGAEIGKIDPMVSTPQEKARRAVLQKDLDAVRAAIAAMGGNVTLQSGSPTMAPPPGAVREVKK
jgi:pyruvate dehydrogenase E2 component (dihydrolipoamide acetyltransferase)